MNIHAPSIAIPEQEMQARLERLSEHLSQVGATGCVLFDRDYILYYTGFSFIPTERPMAFLLSAEGESALFVPRLEVEHAKANARIDQVFHYVEYPDDPHPMTVLKKAYQEMGFGATIAADDDGYPWILGYQGPSLSETTAATVIPLRAFIEAQMMIKSPNELALIRESIRWANLAHTLLQRYTRVGESETEVSERAQPGSQCGHAGRHRAHVSSAEPLRGRCICRVSRANWAQRSHPACHGSQHYLPTWGCLGHRRKRASLGIRIRARTHHDPG